MATIALNYYCDLNQAVKVQYIDGNVFSGDNAGNTISVFVMDGDQPATIGGSVSADVIRADGSTVAVSGALDGNRAYVILPQACYAVPGPISIVIKNTQNTTITTIAALVGNVYRSSTDEIVDPGTIIPSIQSLISAIETAVASIPADYSSLWTSLAPAFSSSANYAAGQYVTNNGGLYRFTKAHSGEWSSSDVVATNLGGDISDLKSAFSNGTGVRPFIDNAYVKKDGSIVRGTSGTYFTDYIGVTSSCKIYAKTRASTSMCAVAFFDSSKAFLTDLRIVGNGYNQLTEYYVDLSAAEYSSVAYVIVSFSASGNAKLENCYCAINGITQKIIEEIDDKDTALRSLIGKNTNLMYENNSAIIGGKSTYTISPNVILNSKVDTFTGEIVEDSNYKRFDFTPTYGGDTLSFSDAGTVYNVCFYDEDRNYVGYKTSGLSSGVPIQGAYYFICTLYASYTAPTVQINNARPALTKIRSIANGNDKDVIKGKQFPGNLINIFDWIDNYRLDTSNGGLIYDDGYFTTGYMPVTAGVEYRANAGRSYVWYNANKEYLSGGSGATIQSGITAPENSAYIRFIVDKELDGIVDPYMLYFTDSNHYSLVTVVPFLVSDNTTIHDTINMAWCDRNDPVALRINNIRDQIYIGYVDSNGWQGIVSYNLETKAINRYIFQKLEADNHNGVSISKLSDGRLICACTGHGTTTTLRIYVSKKPEDISEWETPITVNAVSGYSRLTYNEFVVVNGVYYLFYRCYATEGDNTGEYWGVISSTDGTTWNASNNHVFLYGGGLKYYCVPAVYDTRYIKMFLNSNYSQGATEIRLGYIDTQTGNILDADKTTVLGTLDGEPITYTDFSVVIDKGSYHLQIFKVLEGTAHAVLYAKYIDSTTTENYVAIESGGTWTSYQLPDPGTVIVGGTPNGTAFIDVNNYIACRKGASGFTVDVCTLSNGSVTVSKTLLTTPSADIVAMVPAYSDGYAIFQRGIFTTYKIFNVDAVIKAVT